MVKLTPFKGITYNLSKFDNHRNLFAPPYDVISPQFQDELYNRSEYNVVRLILGKVFPTDNLSSNRYTRAANDYKNWQNEGILVNSETPKMYFYIQKYNDSKGKLVVRKGFIARCYLEDFSSGQVLPHEETMSGPKSDRLNLMETAKANFSQIFSIYSDPEKQVDNTFENYLPEKPFVDVIDDDNVRHIFYEISNTDAIDKVKSLMKDKVVLIADGHHRYETALKYRDNKRSLGETNLSEDVPHNSVMMYFANFDDDGLRVYPTHRVIKKKLNITLDELLEKLSSYFKIEKFNFKKFEECFSLMEKQNPGEVPLGLFMKSSSDSFYVIKPDFEKISEQLKSLNVPEIMSRLDVAILHKLIFEYLINLDTVELKNENNIEFLRNESDVVDRFNKGEAELIFLLNPPDVKTVKDICMSGFRLPQKTTYFYPKLLSGLVINPLE